MSNGIHKIAEASNGKYEIITYRGVEVLIRRSALETAIEISAEWTHDPSVAQLMTQLNIKLRKFR